LLEDLLTVPIKVFAGGRLGTFREEYGVPERRLPVVLPGERIGLDGVGELSASLLGRSGRMFSTSHPRCHRQSVSMADR
jgi:hypothetical protein